MEEINKPYDKNAAANNPAASQGVQSTNSAAENSNEIFKTPESTTGTGYSQAERSGVDPRTEGIEHHGSEALASKFNIDEQAHLDSSTEDFHKTTSNFRHSDGSVTSNDEEL